MPKRPSRATARPLVRPTWTTIARSATEADHDAVADVGLDALRDQLAVAVMLLTRLSVVPAFQEEIGRDPAAQTLLRELARLGAELAAVAGEIAPDAGEAQTASRD